MKKSPLLAWLIEFIVWNTLMCPGFRKSGYMAEFRPASYKTKLRATRMGVLNRNRSGASGDSFFSSAEASQLNTLLRGSGPCVNVSGGAAAGPISRGPDGDVGNNEVLPSAKCRTVFEEHLDVRVALQNSRHRARLSLCFQTPMLKSSQRPSFF